MKFEYCRAQVACKMMMNFFNIKSRDLKLHVFIFYFANNLEASDDSSLIDPNFNFLFGSHNLMIAKELIVSDAAQGIQCAEYWVAEYRMH